MAGPSADLDSMIILTACVNVSEHFIPCFSLFSGSETISITWKITRHFVNTPAFEQEYFLLSQTMGNIKPKKDMYVTVAVQHVWLSGIWLHIPQSRDSRKYHGWLRSSQSTFLPVVSS